MTQPLRTVLRASAIIPLLFIGILVFARTLEDRGRLHAVVKDAKTGEQLKRATVQILETKQGAFTKDSGAYVQNVVPGKYTVVAKYPGYLRDTMHGVVIESGKTTEISFALNAATTAPNITADTAGGGLRVHGTRGTSNSVRLADKTKTDVATKFAVSEVQVVPGSGADVGNFVGGYISTRQSQEFNTAEYSKIVENEYKDVRQEPLSTFSIDVDGASYSNVRRFISTGQMPPADAVRIEEMVNYFKYEYPQPNNGDPFSITTELTECPWNKDHKLALIGLQGKEIDKSEAPPANLTFLIDVSGSMEPEERLPLIRRAFALLVDELRPQDKVAIVTYAGTPGLVLPPTSGEKKNVILEALSRLESGGSTAGGAGLELAYKVAQENFDKRKNNRVILATDGDFNVGISSTTELVRFIEEKRETGIYLTTIGVGDDNYKDARMKELADKGNGNYYYIDNILEAKKVFVTQMGGTLNTIAKDVKIQVEFNPAQVKGYRLIGYESRILAKEDFNNDKKDAGELGSGHTVTALYEIIPAGSSEAVNLVDSLRYQTPVSTTTYHPDEAMMVKFRYKKPDEDKSRLIEHPVTQTATHFTDASNNLRFAAAVASFGMLLRDSKFKGTATLADALALAKSAKGADDEGYRAEFIKLIETYQLMGKAER